MKHLWLTFFRRRHKIEVSKLPWNYTGGVVVFLHIKAASDTGRAM